MVLLQNLNANKMKLEPGTIYFNKTVKYLVPALNFYGPMLKTKLGLVSLMGIGIFDMSLEGSHLEGQKNIYFLINKAHQVNLFQDFLHWLKYQDYYVTDYHFDPSEHSNRHMVVLSFPYEMSAAYDLFLKGKYSKMYTKEELDLYFGAKPLALKVLKRTDIAKREFKKQVFDTFGTLLEEEDFSREVFEYDFPPTKEEEFFNY